MTYTRDEKLREARRELRQRRRVYPRLVQQGKLTRADADRQIAIMEAIAADYEQPTLFAAAGNAGVTG